MSTSEQPTSSTDPASTHPHTPFIWDIYARRNDQSWRRRVVAHARKAITVEPAGSAELWPLYRARETNDGNASLVAEHWAIGLWGLHQQGGTRDRQGETRAVHKRGRNFGAACRALFSALNAENTGVSSPLDTAGDDYVSRRLAAISRTHNRDLAAKQMAALIRNFGGHDDITITCDYTNLYFALLNWELRDNRAETLRRWAIAYHCAAPTETTTTVAATTPSAEKSN